MTKINPHDLCPGQEFEERDDAYIEGKKLYRCTTCGRVSRTKRKHQKPGRNTRSRDNTMGILWGSGKPVLDSRIKGLWTLLGYAEAMHTSLETLRNGHDPQDPVDHNIEQAQINLENASFRMEQVVRHLTDTKKEAPNGS
jgi:hypothetical protein